MRMKFLSSLLLAVILSGCCWLLPEGEPPEGNILDNPQNSGDKVYTVREAVDYMVSALTLAMLERCPGEKIMLVGTADEAADALAQFVLRESGKITGNQRVTAGSQWELRPEVTGEKLTLKLFCQGREVWQESVTYRTQSGGEI